MQYLLADNLTAFSVLLKHIENRWNYLLPHLAIEKYGYNTIKGIKVALQPFLEDNLFAWVINYRLLVNQ